MAGARARTLDVDRVAGALGAIVTGIDLTAVAEAPQLDGLRRALTEHLVVFLPDQDLSLDDLERITDLLGGRDVTPFVDPMDERPYVIRVVKEPGDVLNFANVWHSDLSYLPEPPAFTLLHARRCRDTVATPCGRTSTSPTRPSRGGYRPLSMRCAASTRPEWRTAPAVFSTSSRGCPPWRSRRRTTPSRSTCTRRCSVIPNPAVVALYLNPVYTTRFSGWSKDESEALLSHLWRHSINENFTCRLRWAAGTLAIWDNRCTMHNALNDYSGVRREMYRTSVRGTAPVGPS